MTEGRERPGNFGPEKSDCVIDFHVLYTVKSIPAEGEWRQELQKYYALYQCNNDTGILQWWKVYTPKFLILSLIAASSIPVEKYCFRVLH